jgi:hypothetical protein
MIPAWRSVERTASTARAPSLPTTEVCLKAGAEALRDSHYVPVENAIHFGRYAELMWLKGSKRSLLPKYHADF